MNLCSFGFHKWGKYSEPRKTKQIDRYSGDYYVMEQRRICERCGRYKSVLTNVPYPTSKDD